MKKFLEDKNLDKKVSEKLLDDKFIKKIPRFISYLVLVLFIIDCILTCFLV